MTSACINHPGEVLLPNQHKEVGDAIGVFVMWVIWGVPYSWFFSVMIVGFFGGNDPSEKTASIRSEGGVKR